MKFIIIILVGIAIVSGGLFSFSSNSNEAKGIPASNEEFGMKDYWYSGQAEISSYSLKQARYGEVHEGHSVLVFVTEPFNISKYVKSDYGSADDVSVLKLNNTRKFNTGIYPYSMMTSSFLPFENGEHSFKVSSSSQEWCGHTYINLENRDEFNVLIESYFENESDVISMKKSLLEDDFWSKIRLNPRELPTGNISVVPSFFFLRMTHAECKAYDCKASWIENKIVTKYILEYPGLGRSITIEFETNGPHKILGWKETFKSGFGADAKVLTTEGTLIKTLRSDYWNKNKKSDSYLRTELGLE